MQGNNQAATPGAPETLDALTVDEAARWLAGEVQPPAELPPLVTISVEESTAYVADQTLTVDVEYDEPAPQVELPSEAAKPASDDTMDVDFAAVADAVEDAAADENTVEPEPEPEPAPESELGSERPWTPSLDFIVTATSEDDKPVEFDNLISGSDETNDAEDETAVEPASDTVEASSDVTAETTVEAVELTEIGTAPELESNPEAVAEPEAQADLSMSMLSGLTFAEEEMDEAESPVPAVVEPAAEDVADVEAAALAREVHIHHHYTAPPVPVAPALPAQVYVVEGPPRPQPPMFAIETVPADTDDDVEVPDYVDYGAAQSLPTRPDPGPIAHPAKEPMFVWRGQSIGGAGQKNPTGSTQLPVPAPPKPQSPKRKRRPRQEGDIDGTGVDPQTWFESVVQESLRLGVSDLHIAVSVDESGSDALTARIRIDGQMRDYQVIYGMDARVIINKFKAAADLSSAGSYVPEESIYEVQVDGETRKARIALFRTANGGDALVLRLPPTGPLRKLEDLEFAPSNLTLFHELLRSANRMILIAGPMGSGKTTTAHGALAHISTPNRNVWSVEDPVERDLPGITQLEVDEANGAGFAALLPVLVRSDYDTLFLGEIRDKSTAAAGVRQAKAGRQVITTIHANDNVTALLRLIELAEDTPLSVLDAVLGVVSQRLVRRLNPEWDGADPEAKYRGRVPIHEVLRVNDELVEAVMRDKPIAEIKRIAASLSESTFLKDAQRLVDAGITDQAEVDLVLGH